MTKDEVLKLALEAFEYIENNYMSLPAPATKAITAIREALAQPEQEPVAWVNQANLNSAAIQRNRGGQGDTHTWSETPNAYHPIPLYTTPPQRKPLTDEEILECWKQAYEPGRREHDNAARMARAIEAAHGIKENT